MRDAVPGDLLNSSLTPSGRSRTRNLSFAVSPVRTDAEIDR